MIQGSIKLKSCSLEWLFQPSKLAKFDSLWIRVCAIVAFIGIPGSNIHFPLSFFFLLTTTLLISLFSNKISFSPFFSCCLFLRNPSLPFIMEFWSSRGIVGSPVLPSCELSLFRAYHSISPISRFSHSFLLSALILLKVPDWPPSLGCAEVCPSWHHRFGSSTFPFFFPIWAESYSANLKTACYHSFFCVSLFWFLEVFFCLCHERSLGFTGACVLLLCFLFSSSVSFFRVVLVFLWLCAWKDPRLLKVAEDPDFLSPAVVFFFLLDASSSGL